MAIEAKASPLQRLEGRWTLQLLVSLAQGSQRFSDLRTAIPGVSANLLTVRLRALEQDELVQRVYLPPPAARTVYELGPAGRRLHLALLALEDWSASDGAGPWKPASQTGFRPMGRADAPASDQDGKERP